MGISTSLESYWLHQRHLVVGLIYLVAFLDTIMGSCTHSTIVSNRLV